MSKRYRKKKLLSVPIAKTEEKPKKKEEKPKKFKISFEKNSKNAQCKLAASNLALIKGLHNDPISSDIIVRFANRDFYCHSLVLFQHLVLMKEFNDQKKFTKNKKGDKTIINMKLFTFELTTKEFDIISSYMYLGFFPRPENDEIKTLLRWLEISHYFKIGGLRDVMVAYLGTFMNIIDATKTLHYALEKGLMKLYNVCLTFLEVSDEIIFVKTNEYLKLPFETMKYFVVDGRISIQEDEFFSAVQKYCEHLEKEKKLPNNFKTGLELFKKEFEEFIRYPLMDVEVLAEKIDPTGWVDKKYLLEAYRYLSSDKIQKEFKSPRTKPRDHPPINKFKGSEILSSKDQMILYKFFTELNMRKRNFSLIYKGSRDGFKGQDFHKKCDGKGATMTVILSKCDCVFGGFTSLPWAGTAQSVYKRDMKSFLYCLRKGKTLDPYKCMPRQGSQNHVYHYDYYGPTWGGNHDLYTCQQMDSQNSYSSLGNAFDAPSGKSKQLSEKYNFQVKEIEVFLLK